jgi:hypothetical protein
MDRMEPLIIGLPIVPNTNYQINIVLAEFNLHTISLLYSEEREKSEQSFLIS